MLHVTIMRSVSTDGKAAGGLHLVDLSIHHISMANVIIKDSFQHNNKIKLLNFNPKSK